jgi:hypothetical protein
VNRDEEYQMGTSFTRENRQQVMIRKNELRASIDHENEKMFDPV